MKYALAIDIGASSGRHIVGWCEGGEIKTDEVYRFPNGMDSLDGHLIWDTDRLFSEVLAGLKSAFEKYPSLSSLSIDTWGVDYVLMKGDSEVKPTYAYRDARTEKPIEEVHKIMPHSELYAHTGIQFNSFNTIYQLYADRMANRLDGVTDFLMIPEYLMYKLTGVKKKEFTNATTTGLINCKTLDFDREIFKKLGLPEALIAPISQPGELVGRLTADVRHKVGGDLDVLLCATHDTGSAVHGIPMETNSPYISSGTWSLLGVKTEAAVNDEGSRLADYSNEGGVGYNRYQKNIMGMWFIQSLRKEMFPDMPYDEITKMAEASSFDGIFDVNDQSFMSPESMKGAIYDYFASRGEKTPECEGDYFNAAYRSLAVGYKEAIDALERNTGRAYPEIYIVGGGAKNNYLNSLTENATGKKVKALPVEATAIGNLKIQLNRN